MSKDMQTLFDDMPTEEEEIEVSVLDIEISDYIEPSDDFVKSVRRFGIIEPPLICLKSNRSKKYAVLSGRRRILAARKCGATRIKCVLRKGFVFDSADAHILTYEANRRVNPNPIAEYKAIMALIKEGYSKDDIKRSLGITEVHFKKLAALAVLPADLIEAVKDRKVALSTAESISKMGEVPRNELYRVFEDKGFLTGEDVNEVKRVKRSVAVQDVMSQIGNAQPEDVPARENPIIKKVEALKGRYQAPEADGGGDYWNEAIDEVLEILRSEL